MTVVAPRFSYLQELVLDRAGVVLANDQDYLVEARLGPLARELGLRSGSEVLDTLQKERSASLMSKVVEAMVTGETSWFRDLHPFEALRTTVIPRLLSDRQVSRSLSVWSAACSSGQELYSVAMLLDHFFPETAAWRLRLIGTDISAAAVERAKQGLYSPLEVNRGLPAALLTEYFSRDGTRFRISDSIRAKARFEQLNLVRDSMPAFTIDIVFLRNVLIYLDLPLKKKVLADAWSRVAEGGCLFLGSTETALGLADDLSPGLVPTSSDGATYYQKVRA